MQVNLLKRKVSYKDKDTGDMKNGTNYYLLINEEHVPIQIAYFKDKDTGVDKGYARRKGLMDALASPMPGSNDAE